MYMILISTFKGYCSRKLLCDGTDMIFKTIFFDLVPSLSSSLKVSAKLAALVQVAKGSEQNMIVKVAACLVASRSCHTIL